MLLHRMEQIKVNNFSDTIVAIATPPGVGGIAVIRVSGPQSRQIVNTAWKGSDLTSLAGNSSKYGRYVSTDGEVLDDAVASVFISPASFTGEDTVEISIHGSTWIQKEVLNDLIRRGARMANPGEFTQRAFINGKLDLAQAEGVADLISSTSKAAHHMALNQMRGTFSKQLSQLKEKLIEFASLLELELDFSEEDVEFADRTHLLELCSQIHSKIEELTSSYSRGAVLKNGVNVVLAGIPNAGKSSLLNLLLEDEKAIVTNIPGTTRDIIEDTSEINGILYRFIDTAGLRDTNDIVEGIGVSRAHAAMEKAFIIIWMIDVTADLSPQIKEMKSVFDRYPDKHIIILTNKVDLWKEDIDFRSKLSNINKRNNQPISFSTTTREGLPELLSRLHTFATENANLEKDVIVTNARHYEALIKAKDSLKKVKEGLQQGISSDFVAQDIRETLHYLGTVTGEITTDNLLHSIFSHFCIGK